MTVISLNDNNEITNILNGIPGGKLRQSILTNKNIERLSPIIRLAHKLELDGNNVFIEVKFQSQYNQRYKRLEIVSSSMSEICVYKFAHRENFEQESLELQRIVNELKSLSTVHSFRGFIVLSNFDEIPKSFKDRVKEITPDISLMQE